MTHAQIAQELHVTRQAVGNALRKKGVTRWDGGKSGELHKDLNTKQLKLIERFNLKKRWYSKRTYARRNNQELAITLAQWVFIFEEQIGIFSRRGLDDIQINHALNCIQLLAKDKERPISISNYHLHHREKNE